MIFSNHKILELKIPDKLGIFYFVIVASLVVFAYLPTLQYDYVFNDQWRTFQYSLLDEPSAIKALKCYNSRIGFDIKTGRPLVSIGECLEHAFVAKISDFSKTRPIVLFVVVCTVFCLGMVLSPSLGGLKNGTAIGALFVFSPGYAFIYHIGLSTIMILIALILAAISYVIFRQAIDGNRDKFKISVSAVLFLIACLIYPAWAFVVFVFSLIDYLFSTQLGGKKRLKCLLVKIVFFSIVVVIYYLIIEILSFFVDPGVQTGSDYKFSANFSPTYLYKRFVTALFYYSALPPLNTLYLSLFPLKFVFLFLVVTVHSIFIFKNTNHKFITSVFSVLFTITISISVLFLSISPWLFSNMPNLSQRYFIPFFLFFYTLFVWVIIWISNKLFLSNKYISLLLILFVLFFASVIQNKRTDIEVGTSRIEIKTMRSFVDKYIDENLFYKKRYILVIMPKYPWPAFYDHILDFEHHLDYVRYGGILTTPEDPLFFYKFLFKCIKNDQNNIFARLFHVLRLVGYGDCFSFSGERRHYIQMFSALIREKCNHNHPLVKYMNIYSSIKSSQKGADKILDYCSSNIVFAVMKQGETLETKHKDKIITVDFSSIAINSEG